MCANKFQTVEKFLDFQDYLDIDFLFKASNLVLNVFISPVLCGISFILNVLSILIIQNKNKKEFNLEFYLYMKYNFLFNSFVSIIFLFKLMKNCFGYSSLYCSSIRAFYISQYLHIFLIQYLGQCFKFCSNCSMLLVAYSRYNMFIKNGNKTAANQRKIRKNIMIIFVISLILNIVKLLEFQVIDLEKLDGSLKEFPRFILNPISCDFQNPVCLILYAFDLIFKLFNDIICFILNTIIDIRLVSFLKKKNKETQLALSKKNNTVRTIVIGNSNPNKQTNKKRKSVNKLTFCIFLNGIILIITRFPETISFLFNLIARLKIIDLCFVFADCSVLIELSDFFYLISFTLFFLVNFYFNENFKASFRDLRARLFK